MMGEQFEVGDVVCGSVIDATIGQYTVKDPSTVVDSDPSFLGVVIRDCADADDDVVLKNSGLVTLAVNGEVAIGDTLGVAAGQKYCEAGLAGVGVAKSANASGPGFVRAQLGAGSGGAVRYWSQASEPTPTAGVFNIWKDTDNGHVAFYLDEITTWARVTGFM